MRAIEGIVVDAVRGPGAQLALGFALAGDVGEVMMPVMMAKERADELWRTTCFEAFLALPDEEGYIELNFSPSTRWAAYGFAAYRAGQHILDDIDLPRLDLSVAPSGIALSVVADLSALPAPWSTAPWLLGLSAVVEGRDGRLDYWALAHPPGAPDFHLRDCFVGRLEAPAPA